MKSDHKKGKVSMLVALISLIITPFASLFIYVLDLQLENKIRVHFLTEVTTVLFIIFLIFWYIKSSDRKRRSRVLSIMIGVIAALLLMYGFLLNWFLNLSHEFTTMGYKAEKEFSVQQDKYIPLITTIFDKAEKTNVRHDIDKNYSHFLEYPKPFTETINGNTYKVFHSQGRIPVYFIRLKNGKLQKLFQSGDIKYETIDTAGEKIVRDMLLGKISPIQYPQHTCCGGDDLSWNEEPFFRLFVQERRYLKDFPSELETILLIRDEKGNILGAMVDLHGD